jgi:hypothetical protein
MRQWYFLRCIESQLDWDRHSGSRPYMTVWSIGGSKFSVISPFSNYPQYNCITVTTTFSSSRLAHCSSLLIYVNNCTPRAARRHLPYGRRIVPLAICVNHCTPRAALPPDPKERVCFRTSLMDLCLIIFLFRSC